MHGTTRLFTFVAMTCSGPAILAPVCRWALRALRAVTRLPIRRRARGRPTARSNRPVAEVRRAGPTVARRALRRAPRRDRALAPPGP